jgi:hypothetical protein
LIRISQSVELPGFATEVHNLLSGEPFVVELFLIWHAATLFDEFRETVQQRNCKAEATDIKWTKLGLRVWSFNKEFPDEAVSEDSNVLASICLSSNPQSVLPPLLATTPMDRTTIWEWTIKADANRRYWEHVQERHYKKVKWSEFGIAFCSALVAAMVNLPGWWALGGRVLAVVSAFRTRVRTYLRLYGLDDLCYLGLSEPRFSDPWFVVR